MSRRVVIGIALTALAPAACQLEEIALVDIDDVVVAEVHVQVGSTGQTFASAFLHRTLLPSGAGSASVPGAIVTISRDDGLSVVLAESPLDDCVASTPIGGGGTCYRASGSAVDSIAEGDRLGLLVQLPGGGELSAITDVPGAFSLDGFSEGEVCVLQPTTPLELRWTPSAGARAYANETLIYGLEAALAPQGVTDVDDPLYLLGVSISEADTTIVFPGEFGVFSRFDLDRTVATTLQGGLPPATRATVVISAVDANYVNWARGGNFNPSGQVRVSSVRGDGTGVFGSSVIHSFGVVVPPDTLAVSLSACPG